MILVTGSNIDRLRRIVMAIEARELAAPDDAAWFCEAVEHYQIGAAEGLTLDRALGLAPAPGHRPWWSSEALRARDEALRTVRDQYFADVGIREAARALRSLYPQRSGQVNDNHPLADALKTGHPLPGNRRLRQILGELGNELPPFRCPMIARQQGGQG